MIRVRALFFDLDDTLVDFTTARRISLASVAAFIAETFPDITVDHIIQLRRSHAGTIGQRSDILARRADAWAKVLAHLNADGRLDPHDLMRRVEAIGLEQLRLFPDAEPALHWARATFGFAGIITNGPGETQWPEIHLTGLEAHADRIVVAGDVGAYKPEIEIFQAALRGLDIAPTEVAFVGNSPHHDIQGALDAGWQAIWLNREAEAYPSNARPPTATIHTLADLPNILAPIDPSA